MHAASYVATHTPTLGEILGQALPDHLDDWQLWTRFWQFVACDLDSRCWLWQRPVAGEGYAVIKVAGTNQPAHRIVYQWLVGRIPPGWVIDHLCRVRHCLNPLHLEAVTHAENIRRGLGAPAKHGRKTHCPQGHAYDVANTLQVPRSGGRRCRQCRDSYYAEHREIILKQRRFRYAQRQT